MNITRKIALRRELLDLLERYALISRRIEELSDLPKEECAEALMYLQSIQSLLKELEVSAPLFLAAIHSTPCMQLATLCPPVWSKAANDPAA